MVDKKYYEKLGGFAYLLSELNKKIGREQTDILVNDAVKLCNELCGKYKDLPEKERIHTERMIFPRAAIYLQMIRYIPREEAIIRGPVCFICIPVFISAGWIRMCTATRNRKGKRIYFFIARLTGRFRPAGGMQRIRQANTNQRR